MLRIVPARKVPVCTVVQAGSKPGARRPSAAKRRAMRFRIATASAAASSALAVRCVREEWPVRPVTVASQLA
jgi:hypothetical protein